MTAGEPMTQAENQHIVALATRIGNLAEQLDRLDEDVKEMKARLPTREQMDSLNALLADRAGWEWLKARLGRYGIGLIALLGGIYAARDYLSRFFGAIAQALK